MKIFKNKKIFLICLCGFYALVTIFTGYSMYLPYMDMGDYYEEEDEDYSEEDVSEDEDSYEDEDSSEEEDSEEEDLSEDEDYSEEDVSEEEELSEEELSEEEDSYEDEDTSDNADDLEDFDDTDSADDDDTAEEDSTDTEDQDSTESEDTAMDDSSNPYAGDFLNNSVAVLSPVPEISVTNTPTGVIADNIGSGTSADSTNITTSTVAKTQPEDSNPFPVSFSYNGKGKLNIRKEPSKSSSIVGTISANSTGMILEFANEEWAKVTYNNEEGYVASEYIIYTLPQGSVIPSPKPGM